MKPFTKIASGIFALVCAAHAARLLTKWPINVNGHEVPVWLSAVGVVIAGALAGLVWRESQSK